MSPLPATFAELARRGLAARLERQAKARPKFYDWAAERAVPLTKGRAAAHAEVGRPVPLAELPGARSA